MTISGKRAHFGCDFGLETDDVITMQLDIKEKILVFHVNGKYISTRNKLPLQNDAYNMAVRIRDKGTAIKFIKFDKQPRQ